MLAPLLRLGGGVHCPLPFPNRSRNRTGKLAAPRPPLSWLASRRSFTVKLRHSGVRARKTRTQEHNRECSSADRRSGRFEIWCIMHLASRSPSCQSQSPVESDAPPTGHPVVPAPPGPPREQFDQPSWQLKRLTRPSLVRATEPPLQPVCRTRCASRAHKSVNSRAPHIYEGSEVGWKALWVI